jgi:hypothetical protein
MALVGWKMLWFTNHHQFLVVSMVIHSISGLLFPEQFKVVGGKDGDDGLGQQRRKIQRPAEFEDTAAPSREGAFCRPSRASNIQPPLDYFS